MKLIVGLGNPGRKYKKTRHNIGWLVLDELKKAIDKDKVILLKPTTFMNNSGKEVKSVVQKNKINTEDIIVVHDDIDLPFGTIRTSKDSSSAGHKGVQSIINEIKSQDFTRIRVGIRFALLRSSSFGGRAQYFVLEKFSKEETKQLKQIIKKAVEEIKNSCSQSCP